MKVSQQDYAISLASDLEQRGEKYSATIVRRLLHERCEAVNALRHILAKAKEDWRPDWQEEYALAERAIGDADATLITGE